MFAKLSPRLRLVLAAGAIGAVALTAWVFFTDDAPRAGAVATSQTVALGDIEDSVTAVGTLQPLQFVDVGTQVSGQLKKIHVAFGEAVTQGQLLAEIDPTIYQARVNAGSAQLLNLKAQLAQRQAEQVLAGQQFKRQTELLAERATSQDAYEVAEAELQVKRMQIAALEAQIQQSESTLNADKANLSYTQIYAPMSGVVVDIIAKQGQTLNANQTAPIVLRIANLDTMTVYAQVSEADVNKLTTGMTAYFTTLGQPGRKRYGKLRQVIPTPQLVNNVVLYNALFDVENPDHDLFTQMTAQVFFVVAEAKQVPVVPMTALKQGRGGREGGAAARYSVRVKDGDKIVERPVEVGVMTRLNAEIKVGLNVGEEVMIDTPPAAPRPPQQGGNRGPRI